MASAFPKNASELQTFLGFAGYYQSFMVGLAQTAKPLHQLVAQHSKKQLSKDSRFQWTPTCQAAFETIISKLMSPSVLAYPDFSLPFTLHTNASGEGLARVCTATGPCLQLHKTLIYRVLPLFPYVWSYSMPSNRCQLRSNL